jgi:hypothetical protein
LGVATVTATALLAATTAVHASEPELVGVWPEGPALAVEKAGDLGLISNARVVRTYDISDPSAPVELGSVVLPGAVLDLEIAGDYAYAAVLGYGVAIVDLSQPEMPRLVECPGCRLPDGACSVTLTDTGQYAFARAGGYGEGGVVSFFMTSPTELSVVGRIEPSEGSYAIRSVALDDDNVYVADDSLRIFEIPGGDAHLLGSRELDSYTRKSIAVAGQRVFVGAWTNPWFGAQPSLTIFDVSDPVHPSKLSHVDLLASGYGLGVDLARGLVVSAGPSGYQTSDVYLTSIEEPRAPTLVGAHTSGGSVSDMVLDGEVVIEAFRNEGTQVVDVSDPTAPTALSTIETAGEPIDLEWIDDLLVARLAGGDIRLIDASDLREPVDVGRIPAPAGGEWRHNIATDRALFASATVSTGPPGEEVDRGIIHAIDISDPAAPVVLGEVEIDAYELAMAPANDDVLLVLAWCGDDRCLNAVDVSDPSTMIVASRLVGDYMTDLVAIGGHLVVAANGDSALEMLDVSDPAAMSVVGELAGEYEKTLVVDDGLVLAVADRTRLELIDVTDPVHPVVVSTLQYASHPDLLDVALSPGGTIYLLRYREDDELGVVGFVTVVSIGDGRELRVRSQMDVSLGLNERVDGVVPIGTGRVAITTHDAIPSDFSGPPAIIVDVSIPARPIEVGRISTRSAVTNVAARGSLLAMGSTIDGIGFWDLSHVSSGPVQPAPAAVD